MATRFSGKTSILVLLQPAVYHMNIISQSFTRLKTELIRIWRSKMKGQTQSDLLSTSLDL